MGTQGTVDTGLSGLEDLTNWDLVYFYWIIADTEVATAGPLNKASILTLRPHSDGYVESGDKSSIWGNLLEVVLPSSSPSDSLQRR